MADELTSRNEPLTLELIEKIERYGVHAIEYEKRPLYVAALCRLAKRAFTVSERGPSDPVTLPIEVVSLLNTAATHLRTWVAAHRRGSPDMAPYANTDSVAERLDYFIAHGHLHDASNRQESKT